MNRFKKVYKDLLLNKSRTILVILAIALGVIGAGSVFNTKYILSREMNKNYMDTNPASFILRMDHVDKSIHEVLKNEPDLKNVEVRKTVTARIRTGDNEWGTVLLYTIEDFDNVCIDTFHHEEGSKTPLTGEILIERDALGVAKTHIGDTAFIMIPGRTPKGLKVTGSVHAPGLPAAHSELFSYGFITEDTLKLLGDQGDYNELRVVVSGDIYDLEHIKKVALEVKDVCEENGYIVSNIEIPTPGKHPHGDEIGGFMFVVQAFGILSLVMSGVLVINMISNLLAGQIRQIGIMKSIGASIGQIVRLYYGMVLTLSILSVAIGIPLAVLMGRACAGISGEELNFDITCNSVPAISFVIQVVVGILVPLLAATVPIIKACRVTVRDAISDYGISQNKISVRLSAHSGGSVSTMISIRNTFRKKGRLFLTLGTLILGGTLFILSLNLFSSLQNTVEQSFKAMQYDVEVRLNSLYTPEEVDLVTGEIDGLTKAEYLNYSRAVFTRNNSIASKQYLLKAVPSNATLIKLPLLEGTWYEPGDKNSVVINHILANKESGIKVGDVVKLEIEGKKKDFKVSGIAKEVASQATIYMDRETYLETTGNPDHVNYLLFKTDKRDSDTQSKFARSFELRAKEHGIEVVDTWMTYQHKKSFLDHLTMVLTFLICMAVLTIVVGGMGLASTMGVSVLERMREIGVMRSIGASNKDIIRIIMVEGLAMGTISWILVCILSIPLAQTVGNQIGLIALHIQLDTQYALLSYGIWLIFITIITVVSSLIPARKAFRKPVREIITYE